MKINFDFVRLAKTKLLGDGKIRIYGPLLDELKKLKADEVLELTDKTGRRYVVANWPAETVTGN